MHCHVIGNGTDIENVDNDVYLYAEDNQHWFTRMLANLIEEELEKMEADLDRDKTISTYEYFEVLYRLLGDIKRNRRYRIARPGCGLFP